MSAVASPSASVEAAVALARQSGAAISRAHLYFECDRLAFDDALDALLAAGFELVRPGRRRYVYQGSSPGWVYDAELASGSVGVYLRRLP